MASVQQSTGVSFSGGPFNGFMARQTVDGYKNNDDVMTRGILRRVWNYASLGNAKLATSSFRAANNLGDTLSRQNYSCGGPSQTNASRPGYKRLIGAISSAQCDDSGVAPSTCNTKFVSDSSDFIRYKKQRATLGNYNDLSNGGSNNGAYVPLMRVRRS